MNSRALSSAINRLRRQGYQPYYERGRLVDWRRVRNGQLQIITLQVRPSGRTIVQRSSRGNSRDHKGDRQAEG